MSELNGRLRLPLYAVVAVISAGSGALIAWGAQSTRIEDLEKGQAEIRRIQSSEQTQIAQHDTQLAVQNADFKEILRRLDSIDRRLEEGKPR